MLDHEQILKMHDRAFSRGQVTRERAADDLVFAWVTQWDDQLLGESQLQYRGEFNILRKASRHIITKLDEHPVQVDFEPEDDDYEIADLMDGLYRTGTRTNTSMEAFDNARQESVICGVGGWELENVYDDTGEKQIIVRNPLYEANNTVFWDPNASLLDKSDAEYVSILKRYTNEGYKDFVEELTGERPTTAVSFKYPEESYVFPWVGEDEAIYVGRFYYREKIEQHIHIFVDLMGEPREVLDEDLEDQELELLENGYEYSEEIYRQVYRVTRYIVSGEDILDTTIVPGENIPVVPEYGERQFVEGEEHYEGITRLAKDPQRLRNFQMSYLADIVARSPRRKPIFLPEQIQGFEHMYSEDGSENNYPYLLQNKVTINGEPLPVGPVAEMPEQPMPSALAQSIDLSRQAVEDVANPGLPQNIADPDLSGKAVMALERRMDMQSAIYQKHHKFSLRRDAVIFASMAREVYDSPRKVTLTLANGDRKTTRLMEETFDPQTFSMQTMNDLTSAKFEVYAEIGEDYQTQQQEARADLKEVMTAAPAGSPVSSILLMKYLETAPGSGFEDIRKYASKELIRMGVKEPETEEEIAFYQQLQMAQDGQQDPNMLLAQAELGKAQADQANAQVRAYDAQTKRLKVGVDAEKAGFDIEKIVAETTGKRIENIQRLSGRIQ